MLSLSTTLQIKVYPVFKPNEYFWAHHWKPEQPKWQVFAEVVRREVIAKGFGLKLSDVAMEDKFAFKDVAKGKATLEQVLAKKEERKKKAQ